MSEISTLDKIYEDSLAKRVHNWLFDAFTSGYLSAFEDCQSEKGYKSKEQWDEYRKTADKLMEHVAPLDREIDDIDIIENLAFAIEFGVHPHIKEVVLDRAKKRIEKYKANAGIKLKEDKS